MQVPLLRFRQKAGWFVRGKALQESSQVLISFGILFGLVFASLFNLLVTPWIGNELTAILYLALALGLLAAWSFPIGVFLIDFGKAWMRRLV